jgi:PKD repeat protein
VPADQPIGEFETTYVAGQTIAFGEDLSNVLSPPPPGTYQYYWSFGDGTSSVGLTATHTYTKPGTYNVHASVYPSIDGNFDSAKIHVVASATANAPIAKIAASTLSIPGLGKITFDASGSHSQDGSQLTYLWNFNDGNTASTEVATHKFPDFPGNWLVGLTVTDGRGVSSFTTANIRIFGLDQLPTAALTSSLTTIGTGNTVTFDASGSAPPAAPTTQAGGQIVKYIWNFGDDTPQVTTSNPMVTHRFNRAGTFTVVVQAVDQEGAPGTASKTITVDPLADTTGPAPWMLFGGLGLIVAILALGWYLLSSNQRRRTGFASQQAAAMEQERLRRARAARGASQPGGYRRSASRPGGAPPQPGRQSTEQRTRHPGTPNDGW